MLLLAFTYPFDFERHAFLTRHCRASTLCVSSSILVWLYCSDWHRSGASNSLYIVGQMHPTLILSGLDQWNAWSLCDCVLNVKVQCFCYGLMNQRECTISTGMFTEKKRKAHREIWSFFQLHLLTLPDANRPFIQAWDRGWEYNNLWPPEAGSVSLNMDLTPGKTLGHVTWVQVVS